MMLLAINPPISGSSANPLCVALIPCTTCMYSGMNITTPRNAVLITNDASAAMRNEWMRNRCSGRIGCVARVSIHRKIPSETPPTANNDEDVRRVPRIARAAEREAEQQRRGRQHHEHRAEIVDASARAMPQHRHAIHDHEEREQTERQVDVEHPAPAGDLVTEQHERAVIGEQAADERTDDGRDAEHRAEHAEQPAALARRIQVRHDRERHGHQRARAEALDRAAHDELHHAAAEHRQRAELPAEPAQRGARRGTARRRG